MGVSSHWLILNLIKYTSLIINNIEQLLVEWKTWQPYLQTNEFTLPYMNLINVKELMIIITCTTIPSSLKIWMCEFGSRRYVHLNGQQILHKAAVSNNWDFGYKHCMKREKTCSNMLYTRLSKDVSRTELQQTTRVRKLVCHIISKFHESTNKLHSFFT